MKTIYFVRHGESQANSDGLLAGATTDSPLTPLGERQARELAMELSDKEFGLIVSSPMERAAKTAEIIASTTHYGGKIEINQLFTERDFGSAAGMPRAEGLAALDDGTATGVEPIQKFADRAKLALDWLRNSPADHILVVSHAAFGRMFGTVANGGRPEDFLTFQRLSNGGVQEFTLE